MITNSTAQIDVSRLLAAILVKFGPFEVDVEELSDLYQNQPEDLSIALTQDENRVVTIELFRTEPSDEYEDGQLELDFEDDV